VLFWTERKIFGEGVNRLGAIGSSVIVERNVGVKNGKGVFVASGDSLSDVVVGSAVLMTNRSGVLEAGNANGVAVGAGELVGVGDCKNGIDMGSEEQPERREIIIAMKIVRFIIPLLFRIL
jgi:hypothetical protein